MCEAQFKESKARDYFATLCFDLGFVINNCSLEDSPFFLSLSHLEKILSAIFSFLVLS